MTLKSYNLEGQQHAGKTLVGNWFEEREWQDDMHTLMKSTHGAQLTAQPGYEHKVYKSTAQKAFQAPDVKHRKVPPRQAMREQADLRSLTRDIKEEELAAEDHSMQFTRGRFLKEPQFHEGLQLDYLNDEPITLYSEKPGHHFGKDSHFTQPIQDYTGHRIVKDD